MKYDDASWHAGESFPNDLAPEAAGTHTGMFVAWALLAGLGSELHVLEQSDELERLRQRRITPGQFFLLVCSGKFLDEDLNAEGNAFAQAYFELDRGNYLGDYREYLVKGLASEYHVSDTWTNFEKLRPVLDRRLANWRRGRPVDASPNVKVTGTGDLPEDIEMMIGADFGIAEAPGVAMRLAGFVGQYADRYKEAPDARTLRCIVFLAGGDRRKLEDACRLALDDMRSLVMQAEYDESDRRVRDFNEPFET
ncbi:MAG TPA: hypothetical protein VL219_03365 [Steroidobacteraceae bacterium]|jgi:hypothetical protein|nr:hypothetical protein [Steroidobacteraceae bacterium]